MLNLTCNAKRRYENLVLVGVLQSAFSHSALLFCTLQCICHCWNTINIELNMLAKKKKHKMKYQLKITMGSDLEKNSRF